jgi:hypothetical protein
LYNIQFVNKTFEDVELTLRIKDRENAAIRRVGEEALRIPASGTAEGVFFIEMPREDLVRMKTELVVQLLQGDEVMDEVKTSFTGPVTRSVR